MRYLLQVTSRALPGREADYDRWYEETHIDDVLAVPGFKACERFERLGPDHQGVSDLVAVYEVETDDAPALLNALFAASPNMRLTDAIDMESVRFEFLRPIGKGRKVKA